MMCAVVYITASLTSVTGARPVVSSLTRIRQNLLGSHLIKLADMKQTVTVGTSVIHPAAVVRDLGVLLDQDLRMSQHIARVKSSCFYQLRQLRQIRRPVGQELVAQLVHSFVLSRLDYGNSFLAGLPK